MNAGEQNHVKQIKASQNVFRLPPSSLSRPKASERPWPSSIEFPDESTLDRFWRRVVQLTTRYHDAEKRWTTGGTELRDWNMANRKACDRCLKSRTRVCVIDEDQPSCRPCRAGKLGCDRKTLFVYDLTKAEYFRSYDQFLAVYQHKDSERMKRYIKVPGLPRRHFEARHTDTDNKSPLTSAEGSERENENYKSVHVQTTIAEPGYIGVQRQLAAELMSKRVLPLAGRVDDLKSTELAGESREIVDEMYSCVMEMRGILSRFIGDVSFTDQCREF
ncbi:hypothetical protein B0H11DRAFT_2063289 [Mycena galericulata]|nr:hypothetical protein B0H11DRAFT_2063289 [Mycena galericulata]